MEQMQKDEEVKCIINKTTNGKHHVWPAPVRIELGIAKLPLPHELLNDDPLYQQLGQPLQVQCYDLSKDEGLSYDIAAKLVGGFYPHDVVPDDVSMLENPGNGSIGFLFLPNNSFCQIWTAKNLHNEKSVSFCLRETKLTSKFLAWDRRWAGWWSPCACYDNRSWYQVHVPLTQEDHLVVQKGASHLCYNNIYYTGLVGMAGDKAMLKMLFCTMTLSWIGTVQWPSAKRLRKMSPSVTYWWQSWHQECKLCCLQNIMGVSRGLTTGASYRP